MISSLSADAGESGERWHPPAWVVSLEPWPLALAAAIWVGALCAVAVPVAVAVPLAAYGLIRARPFGVLLAGAVLSTALAAQCVSGLAPAGTDRFSGIAQLVADPTASAGSVEVDVRTSVGRFRLIARGEARGTVAALGAGDRIVVDGTLSPLTHPMPWRHLRGILVIDRSGGVLDRAVAVDAVDAVRGLVERGAASLSRDQRSLLLGFVDGDIRDASAVTMHDFEAAGLSHLLVVSGENLAFVLALAMPLMARISMRRRMVAVALLLLLFGAVTRFQPSVLRAVVMALVAATGVTIGRRIRPTRVLWLAVAALVLIDPMLVHSVGFELSVAATAGIVLLARPIAERVPGPWALGMALGVTLAAQLAVAPILIPMFGAQPLVAIPANLLAEPVAGLVMMWGSSAGLLAGIVGGPIASFLHLPTRVGLWWIASVARIAAAPSLGRIGLVSILGVVTLVVLASRLRRRHRRVALCTALLALGVLLWSLRPPHPPAGGAELDGARLVIADDSRHTAVLTFGGEVDIGPLLVDLRRRGVQRLDLVVELTPAAERSGALAELASRVTVERSLGPSSHVFAEPGGRESVDIDLGALHVSAAPSTGGLQVDVEQAPGHAGPPIDR